MALRNRILSAVGLTAVVTSALLVFGCAASDQGGGPPPSSNAAAPLVPGQVITDPNTGKSYLVQDDMSLVEVDPATGMPILDPTGNPIVVGSDDITVPPATPGAGPDGPGGGLIGDDDQVINDGPGMLPPGCGNGQLDPGEICDDGNTIVGNDPTTWDGCGNCDTIDPGFVCGEPGQPCVYSSYCGDGRVTPPEACDDLNETDGDGCSNCAVETGWACPTPGQPCVYTVACGDGVIAGAEVCDDGNTTDGDGCSADCMVIEPGWTCSTAGLRCTPTCGDGVPVGRESCDDGNTVDNDGCSAACQVEPVFLDPITQTMVGWTCPETGGPCTASVCGDGVVTGEPCDDGGNNDMGDGCSPGCRLEPDCTAPDGSCVSQCGDGLILAGDNEECDDGNNRSGDGCSSDCKVEPGFMCDTINDAAGATLTLPIVYRDFYGVGWDGAPAHTPPYYNPTGGHPDFENETFSRNTPKVTVTSTAGNTFDDIAGPTRGMVNVALGAQQTGPMAFKPVFAATGTPAQITSAATFHQWYVDTPGVNVTSAETLLLNAGAAAGTFLFDTDAFYPIDGRLLTDANAAAPGPEPMRPLWWLDGGCGERQADGEWIDLTNGATDMGDPSLPTHNYSFTSEVRYWFEFQGGENLDFRGDDDVWVFIKKRLVVDLGGNHEPYGGDLCGNIWSGIEAQPTCGGLTPTTSDRGGAPLNLEVGKVYEAVVFQAERHTCQSNYRLTISNFARKHSSCYAVCGDGVIAGDEQCDDGPMNGMGYGYCKADCTPGPRCGDNMVTDGEQCDNGINLDLHLLCGQDGKDANGQDCVPSCAPGCVFPGYCGDGVVQPDFGERCDNGTDANTGAYNGCTPTCDLGPRCGDGVLQSDVDPPEDCDDGNRRNGDGCSGVCTKERVAGAR